MPATLTTDNDGLPMRASGEWAKEKLDYLRRYIAVFEKAMHGKWTRRNYIDLQAGPGKNVIAATGEIVLGSPLLALTADPPFTGYYFAELDQVNANALQQRCRQSPYLSSVSVYIEDCNVAVNDIVAGLNRNDPYSLNLAFLDPEGFELKWSTVAALASVRRMDLIINYPEGGLNRVMRKEWTDERETSVDQFFGTREWRQIYADHLARRTFGVHRRLIDLYQNRLRSLGYQEVVQADQLTAEPLMRNTVRKAPLYRLIFASKSQLGNKFWREITKRDLFGQKGLFE